MHRLPPEILSIIFVASLSPFFSADPDAKGHDSGRQLCANVCRYWYQVVRNTPAMWALFKVDVNPNPQKIRRQLELAKATFLHIRLSLNIGSFRPEKYKGATDEALAVLAEKAEQWKSLSIKGSVAGREELCALLPPSLPHLLSASVSVHVATYFTIPHMEETEVEDWGEVVDWEEMMAPPGQVVPALPTPVQTVPVVATANGWEPRISAPKLQQLVISGRRDFLFADYPKLRSLQLLNFASCWGDPGRQWQTKFGDFITFLGQNCPALQSLTFQSDPIPDHQKGFAEASGPPAKAWDPLPLTSLEFSGSSSNVVRFFLHHLEISSPFALELIRTQ
ncbi:hypothetical protein FRB90_005961 [Tulasnella sp. 427]|nr:hypothetical protein FRB90_005961 [Tulasnella sp. 427]